MSISPKPTLKDIGSFFQRAMSTYDLEQPASPPGSILKSAFAPRMLKEILIATVTGRTRLVFSKTGSIRYLSQQNEPWPLPHTISPSPFQLDRRVEYKRRNAQLIAGNTGTFSWLWGSQKLCKSQKTLVTRKRMYQLEFTTIRRFCSSGDMN